MLRNCKMTQNPRVLPQQMLINLISKPYDPRFPIQFYAMSCH